MQAPNPRAQTHQHVNQIGRMRRKNREERLEDQEDNEIVHHQDTLTVTQQDPIPEEEQKPRRELQKGYIAFS